MLPSRLKDIELPNRRNTHLSDPEIDLVKENWSILSRDELLEELNCGRIRKISRQRLYSIAFQLGIHKSKKTHWYNERKGSHISPDKLTCVDRILIKRMYKTGMALLDILNFVNMKKDIKISMDELESWVTDNIINMQKIKGAGHVTAFSEGDTEFIIQNLAKLSHFTICVELNKSRKIKIHQSAVRSQIKRLKMGKNNI